MRKIIRKFKRHYQRWKRWEKDCLNNKPYKIMVLLGLRNSPSFEFTLIPDEYPKRFFYEDDKFCECGEVEHGGEK